MMAMAYSHKPYYVVRGRKEGIRTPNLTGSQPVVLPLNYLADVYQTTRYPPGFITGLDLGYTSQPCPSGILITMSAFGY